MAQFDTTIIINQELAKGFIEFCRCSTWNMFRFILFIPLLVGFSACKEAEINAYLKDPLYQYYNQKISEFDLAIKGDETSIESLKAEIELLHPYNPQRRSYQKIIISKKNDIKKWQRMKNYYTIKKKRRIEMATREYLFHFKNDLPWPDPKWKEKIETHDRLITANPVYEKKLPKIRDRYINYKKERGLF